MNEIDIQKVRESQIARGKEILLKMSTGYSEDDKALLLQESYLILDLSVRPLNGIKSLKIHTIGDLIATPIYRLMQVSKFGNHAFAELETELGKYNLKLSKPIEPPFTRTLVDPENKDSSPIPILEESIRYLDISVMTLNLFRGQKLLTIGDVVNTPTEYIMGIRGFGNVSFMQLEQELARHGLEILDSAAYKAGEEKKKQLIKEKQLAYEARKKSITDKVEQNTHSFVMRLILANRFSDKEIAGFAAVTTELVQRVRAEIKNIKP